MFHKRLLIALFSPNTNDFSPCFFEQLQLLWIHCCFVDLFLNNIAEFYARSIDLVYFHFRGTQASERNRPPGPRAVRGVSGPVAAIRSHEAPPRREGVSSLMIPFSLFFRQRAPHPMGMGGGVPPTPLGGPLAAFFVCPVADTFRTSQKHRPNEQRLRKFSVLAPSPSCRALLCSPHQLEVQWGGGGFWG